MKNEKNVVRIVKIFLSKNLKVRGVIIRHLLDINKCFLKMTCPIMFNSCNNDQKIDSSYTEFFQEL
uniref:Uncharacterized protein n=1 Tax=Romanomermis culicivorax TaxID=13658 RepID=A0A915KFD7_ROMCU